MGHKISEDDWERIKDFANQPTYQRDPDMLLPELVGEEEE